MTTLLAVSADATGAGFSWTAIAIAVVLLVLNGGFVAAEIALLAARRTRVEEAADAGDPRAVRALASLRELSITFSGAQLGITMCSLGLGAVAEPAVASLFAGWLSDTALPTGAVPVVAVVLALSVVVFLHMVIGEMAPKNLALAEAEAVAFRLVAPLRVVRHRPPAADRAAQRAREPARPRGAGRTGRRAQAGAHRRGARAGGRRVRATSAPSRRRTRASSALR